MSYDVRESDHHFEVFDYSGRGLDWFDQGPEFGDDALLKIAYAISEWVIFFCRSVILGLPRIPLLGRAARALTCCEDAALVWS